MKSALPLVCAALAALAAFAKTSCGSRPTASGFCAMQSYTTKSRSEVICWFVQCDNCR